MTPEELKNTLKVGMTIWATNSHNGDLIKGKGYRIVEDFLLKDYITIVDETRLYHSFTYECFHQYFTLENPNTMKKEITLDQAKSMYGKNATVDATLLTLFPELKDPTAHMVKSWEELEQVNGIFIDDYCEIRRKAHDVICYENHRNIHATAEQALHSLAYPQLTQLMKQANGDWVADWGNETQTKFAIDRYQNQLEKRDFNNCTFSFLAFPCAEIRDKFLEYHRDLIETFYQIKGGKQ